MINRSDIPDPRIEPLQSRWSAYTAAVGGMGAGVVNAVLVRAGMKCGYDVNFLDKKGLAIRNGGVYGHVVFSKVGPVSSPVIPYGKADLLIGLDILEAARGLDARTNLRVAHAERTRAVVNTHKTETILSLMGRQDFDPDKLEAVIQSKARPEGYISADFSKISEEKIGSKLYANMMTMGAAYQMGWIPLKEEQIFEAIKESVRKADVESNFQAFWWGRYLACHPDRLHPAPLLDRVEDIIDEKAGHLEKRNLFPGKSLALSYRDLMEKVCRWMDLSRDLKRLMAVLVYDLIRYDGPDLASRFVQLVWDVHKKDQSRFGYRATETVIKNLFKCMAIKDEIWVAELLTSPEKYARDRKRYHVDHAQGDKITYLHLNRPRFTIFGINFEFDIQTRDWMLLFMREAKFLRTLLPQWHKAERAFRDWYIPMVEKFNYFESPADYDAYVHALSVPEKVRGYREIRYPLMSEAQRLAAAYLDQIRTQRYESLSRVP